MAVKREVGDGKIEVYDENIQKVRVLTGKPVKL